MRLTRIAVLLTLVATGASSSQTRQRPRPRPPRAASAPAPSPYAGNKAAISDGEKLYVAYNCVDCHGGGGSGLMAPSLADNRWRYGGAPGDIFASITQGRPEGMPTWGPLIPKEQVWKLVAYVQTLGEGKDVTTQTFVGKVQRTGH